MTFLDPQKDSFIERLDSKASSKFLSEHLTEHEEINDKIAGLTET